MAMEPITVFARIAEPAAVANKLREFASDLEIDGSDDNWRNATVSFQAEGQTQRLTFTYDPEYASEPNWSRQMSGLRNYLSQFPETDRKARALMLPTTLRICLGTIFDPDFDPAGDPRLSIVFSIAEILDGVLFTPSSLRDAEGRILFGAGGEEEEDPDAVWPKVIAEVNIAPRTQPAEMIDEDHDKNAPTAARVGRRALALSAVTARAVLEREQSDPNCTTNYEYLLGWIEALELEEELEPNEWEVVQRPLGRLNQQDQLNSTWRLEGLGVIAWALGRYDLPPHDELVSMNDLWNRLGLFDEETASDIMAGAVLRPREELNLLCNRLFAIHWRLRNFYLDRKVIDFSEFARSCWFGPLDISGLALVEGDLSIQGERIDNAPDDLFAAAHSAALERHKAANWLTRGPARYSEACEGT